MTAFDFCTCDNFNCVHHPKNTDGTCTACVAKNLKNNEIPSCFFSIKPTESKSAQNTNLRILPRQFTTKINKICIIHTIPIDKVGDK